MASRTGKHNGINDEAHDTLDVIKAGTVVMPQRSSKNLFAQVIILRNNRTGDLSYMAQDIKPEQHSMVVERLKMESVWLSLLVKGLLAKAGAHIGLHKDR